MDQMEFFGGDVNFNANKPLQRGLRDKVVVIHDAENITESLHNVLLSYGIPLENFRVSESLDHFLVNHSNHKQYQSNKVSKYLENMDSNQNNNSNVNNNGNNSNVLETQCVGNIPIPHFQRMERLIPLACTHDRGSNIVKSTQNNPCMLGVPCASHGGNNGLKTGTNGMFQEVPSEKKKYDNAKKIIKFQKKSHMGSKLKYSVKCRPETRFCGISEETHSMYKSYNQLS